MSSMIQTVAGALFGRVESPVHERAEHTRSYCTQSLVGRLRGVPKEALKSVLGDELGDRVWRHARGQVRWPEAAMADRQVVAGLIGHLCRQAAIELSKADRQAKYVHMTVRHEGGQPASAHGRLADLAQSEDAIKATALSLLARVAHSPCAIQSVDLDVTTVADTVPSASVVPAWSTAPPDAAMA